MTNRTNISKSKDIDNKSSWDNFSLKPLKIISSTDSEYNPHTREEELKDFNKLKKIKTTLESQLLNHPSIIEQLYKLTSHGTIRAYFLKRKTNPEQRKIFLDKIQISQKYFYQTKDNKQNVGKQSTLNQKNNHPNYRNKNSHDKIYHLLAEIPWRTSFLIKIFNNLPSKLQDTKCRKAVDAYSELFHDIVLKHQNLVTYTVNKHNITSAKFDDAKQNGMIGLMNAVNLFDTGFNSRFSTYASFWIKSRMLVKKYHDNDGEIQISQFQPDLKYVSFSSLDTKKRPNFIETIPSKAQNSAENFYNFFEDNGINNLLSEDQVKLLTDYYLHNKTIQELGAESSRSKQAISLQCQNILDTLNTYFTSINTDQAEERYTAIRRGFSLAEFNDILSLLDDKTKNILNGRFNPEGGPRVNWNILSKENNLSPHKTLMLYLRGLKILEYCLNKGYDSKAFINEFENKLATTAPYILFSVKSICGIGAPKICSRSEIIRHHLKSKKSIDEFNCIFEKIKASPYFKMFSLKNIFPKREF